MKYIFKVGDKVTIGDNPSDFIQTVDAKSRETIQREGATVSGARINSGHFHKAFDWQSIDLEGYSYLFFGDDLKPFGE